MKCAFIRYFFIFFISLHAIANSELDIKPLDDSETPNVLYVVPWVETSTQKMADPKLVLHELMSDLYDPQLLESTEDETH